MISSLERSSDFPIVVLVVDYLVVLVLAEDIIVIMSTRVLMSGEIPSLDPSPGDQLLAPVLGLQ